MGDAIQMYAARQHYLRGLSDSALSERLVHWMNNCTQLSSTGMVDLCATENPDYFHRLMDVLAETTIRHGDVSKAQDRKTWDAKTNVMIKPSEQVSLKINELRRSLLSKKTNALLLRFGTKKYMRELYETGGLLLQEASTFSEAENLPMRDDELNLLLKRYVPKDELSHIPSAPVPETFDDNGVGLNLSTSCPDFLVLCMTDTANLSVFRVFETEGCLT